MQIGCQKMQMVEFARNRCTFFSDFVEICKINLRVLLLRRLAEMVENYGGHSIGCERSFKLNL